ncbi:MAG: HAMP domain-containing histidine kinase [Peptococcaceae bacterium]|nr:HAMP domain-containing histidine kinase [Peptococcaceae bacterium]
MKAKINIRLQPILRILLIFLTAYFLCLILYALVDNTFNGVFLDWFNKHYILEYNSTNPTSGREMWVQRPNWPAIKTLFLQLFIGVVFVSLAIILYVTATHSRRHTQNAISEISTMMRNYMAENKEATDIFPPEYSEISTQMVEIKSQMLRNEQILKEEAARKNDLITYLAHDLKTPLTSIIGYLSLLDEASDMPDAQKQKYTKITLEKSLRLEKLINEFFDITRYNLQQIYLEKESIDLSYMLMQMTDEFYPILQAHGNTAQLDTAENIMITGDSIKLARVFQNLFKNAISYSYPDTVIHITAVCDEASVTVTFSNQGKTIPEHKLDMIFEKFFRLDEARTTNTGGAGLGLAIAKEIVTLHGGEITATSADEKTTFTVTLPL